MPLSRCEGRRMAVAAVVQGRMKPQSRRMQPRRLLAAPRRSAQALLAVTQRQWCTSCQCQCRWPLGQARQHCPCPLPPPFPWPRPRPNRHPRPCHPARDAAQAARLHGSGLPCRVTSTTMTPRKRARVSRQEQWQPERACYWRHPFCPLPAPCRCVGAAGAWPRRMGRRRRKHRRRQPTMTMMTLVLPLQPSLAPTWSRLLPSRHHRLDRRPCPQQMMQ